MQSHEIWLADRGPEVAGIIDTHAVTICERVSVRLTSSFPNLCYDPLRFDAAAFQKHTFHETPRRLHRLLQVVLLCNTPAVIEREYRWGWRLLSRYQVDRRHLLAHIRWYFEELFANVPLSSDDKLGLVGLRDHVLHAVEQITTSEPHLSESARRRQRSTNGNGHIPGRPSH